MSEGKGYWFLLSGLLIGLVLGLLYSRAMDPVQYYDVSPGSLGDADKDQYRSMVALAYDANGDIGRARARIRLLSDEKTVWSLSAQAQRILAENGEPLTARSLAQLASALGQESEAVTSTPAQVAVVERIPTSTPEPEDESEVTSTEDEEGEETDQQEDQKEGEEGVSTATPEKEQTEKSSTPRAAATPEKSTGQGIPFELTERETVCDSRLPEGLIQVIVQDEDGKPMPGVMIDVAWESGENQFFTGLYPEIDAGYADFQMQPGMKYSLRVGDSGETISDIEAKTCEGEENGGATGLLGGWKLRFIAQ